MGGKSVPFPRRFGRVLRPSNQTGVVAAEEKSVMKGQLTTWHESNAIVCFPR